jgi:hypothetical protein
MNGYNSVLMRSYSSFIPPHSLNKAMQINLGCLLLHLVFYTSIPALLLARHNPFGHLVVALAVVAMIGLWLCLDFMLPIYMEAKMGNYRNISKPIGWLITLNAFALSSIGYCIVF